MSTACRALVCAAIITGTDILAFLPALFDARCRSPRRVVEALAVAAAASAAIIAIAVAA